MHNWLEHLTHTNIHIRREEATPQGGTEPYVEGRGTTAANGNTNKAV